MMNKILIQYLTQVLSNKNSPTEKNRQLRKMETLHNETIHNQTTQNKHYHKNKEKI